jgi:hypothetical protein
MPFLRMEMRYPTLTGQVRDTQVNVLHFQAGTVDRDDMVDTVAVNWAAFLGIIDESMSDEVFMPDGEAVWYDLSEPEPRVPFRRVNHGLTLRTDSQSCPLETSICCSFQGGPASGANAARRRGRIYLPTPVIAWLEAEDGIVRVAPSVAAALAAGMKTFRDSCLAAAEPAVWSVYSPTTHAGGASLAASFTAIERGWVDQEPDTQRRRGGTAELGRSSWIGA